ncbi:MAG: hypothetical protein IT376_05725 [Polyangiaceae bacterium]|nr:hypothetical protein [Polyangiaceae bacterium]
MPQALPVPGGAPVPAIEDPGGTLARFHAEVAQLTRGRATQPLRIAFYGDSNLTLDQLTGALRRTLQHQHGDAGHGYVAVGKPWRWYSHEDVTHEALGEWAIFTPTTVRDRRAAYGLGGILAATRERGARARFGTAPAGAEVGTRASRFGVLHARSDGGGAFAIRVDGAEARRIDTSEGDEVARYATVEVPDAPHRFEIVAEGARLVRLYGVVLERAQGVVVDSLGIGGVSYWDLSRFDEELNVALLRARPWSLVLFLVGANTFKHEENAAAVARLVALHRRAVPGVPIVVMSPPDHAARPTDATSDPRFARIAAELRQAALGSGAAFWDLRQAMGGEGSMPRFFHAGLAARDLYHFTREGAAVMASRVAHALWGGAAHHLARDPALGCY